MSRALGRLAGAVLGLAMAGAHAQDAQLPRGPGAELVYARCQTCHSLQYVVDAKGLLPVQWQSVLLSMKDYGLQLSASDAKQLLQYLTTYLGTAPPPPAGARPQAQPQRASADGAAVYAQTCAICHGEQGLGQPGSFPPLAGNPDLAKDREFPVLVVLHGLSGPIEVSGARFDSAMPAFDSLSDAEIASVVNHVRSAWGNAAGGIEPVTADLVARLRKHEMAPEQVRAAWTRMH
jgi:mono/diheme cytochrome c family protein